MRFDLQQRIEIKQPTARGFDLEQSDRAHPVNDLALQVALLDHVEVDQPQRPHSSSR